MLGRVGLCWVGHSRNCFEHFVGFICGEVTWFILFIPVCDKKPIQRLAVVEEGRGERQGEEAVSMPMSELLARADFEEIEAKRGDPPQMQV